MLILEILYFMLALICSSYIIATWQNIFNHQGFILNHRRYLDRYGMFHKVGCLSFRSSTSHSHPQPFARNTYRKAVNNDSNELDDFYKDKQEQLGAKRIYPA